VIVWSYVLDWIICSYQVKLNVSRVVINSCSGEHIGCVSACVFKI
jgi:hypothetical protein